MHVESGIGTIGNMQRLFQKNKRTPVYEKMSFF